MKKKDEKFNFGLVYQKKILKRLIEDNSFLAIWASRVKREHFENSILGYIFELINKYYKKYKKNCNYDYLIQSASLDISSSLYAQTIVDIQSQGLGDTKYTEDLLSQFIRNQSMKAAILQSVDLLENGKYSEIATLIDKASRAEREYEKLGIFYFQTYKERQEEFSRRQLLEKVPTLIRSLDAVIGGGLEKGELGAVIAFTGVGKSFSLLI